MISAALKNRDASSAKRIISTAPIAKFGAKNTGSPAARPLGHHFAGLPAGRADDAGNAGRERAGTFGTTAAGVVKSTIASASASVATSSCPAASSAGPSTAPTFPVPARA